MLRVSQPWVHIHIHAYANQIQCISFRGIAVNVIDGDIVMYKIQATRYISDLYIGVYMINAGFLDRFIEIKFFERAIRVNVMRSYFSSNTSRISDCLYIAVFSRLCFFFFSVFFFFFFFFLCTYSKPSWKTVIHFSWFCIISYLKSCKKIYSVDFFILKMQISRLSLNVIPIS